MSEKGEKVKCKNNEGKIETYWWEGKKGKRKIQNYGYWKRYENKQKEEKG